MKSTLRLLLCILLPLAVGGISGFATASGMDSWYYSLTAPSFNPPGWVFGPVWTALYILMGISFYLIVKSPPSEDRTAAFLIFIIQLVLNFAWSFLFFKFRMTGVAFIEILLMWISILLMIRLFKKVNLTAAILQIPYLLWVSFASVLNGAYWWLNK
jgi:benzodiazapine receptor